MKIPLMKNAFLHEKETKEKLAGFILSAPRLSMDIKCFEFENEFKIKQEREMGASYTGAVAKPCFGTNKHGKNPK